MQIIQDGVLYEQLAEGVTLELGDMAFITNKLEAARNKLATGRHFRPVEGKTVVVLDTADVTELRSRCGRGELHFRRLYDACKEALPEPPCPYQEWRNTSTEARHIEIMHVDSLLALLPNSLPRVLSAICAELQRVLGDDIAEIAMKGTFPVDA